MIFIFFPRDMNNSCPPCCERKLKFDKNKIPEEGHKAEQIEDNEQIERLEREKKKTFPFEYLRIFVKTALKKKGKFR